MGKRAVKSNQEWSRWYLVPEKQKTKDTFVIRRYSKVEGKTVWERYPREEYSALGKTDLEVFVVRLNGEMDLAHKRAKEAYEIKHQFITVELQEEWEAHVRSNQNNVHQAHQINTMVRHKFLHFFIHKLEMADPVDWYANQDTWGKALLNIRPEGMSEAKWEKIRLFDKGISWSSRTIGNAIQFSNRFIKFIHQKKPRLFPLLVFDPIPKAVLKRHDAKRNLDLKRDTRGKVVRDEHWEVILKKTNPKILPFIKLAYTLGLRDGETLGVKLNDVMKKYFHLQRQLISNPNPLNPQFGPPKNNQDRKVFYWFTNPNEVYKLISELPPRMHPNTLSKAVTKEMKRVGFDYQMHDFRRTFITKALKAGYPQIDVRDAAGHQDLQTTNLYAIRDEFFDDEPFKPE